jgi:ubiquinone biosynthesis protein UbiJ
VAASQILINDYSNLSRNFGDVKTCLNLPEIKTKSKVLTQHVSESVRKMNEQLTSNSKTPKEIQNKNVKNDELL